MITDWSDKPPPPADKAAAPRPSSPVALKEAHQLLASIQHMMGALHHRGQQDSLEYRRLLDQYKRLGGVIRQSNR